MVVMEIFVEMLFCLLAYWIWKFLRKHRTQMKTSTITQNFIILMKKEIDNFDITILKLIFIPEMYKASFLIEVLNHEFARLQSILHT